MSDFAREIDRQNSEDAATERAWALGDYTGDDCENCGRNRVCKCDNGMRRCEKCNWCPEIKDYAPVPAW